MRAVLGAALVVAALACGAVGVAGHAIDPQNGLQPPNSNPPGAPNVQTRLTTMRGPLVLPRRQPLCYVQRVEARPGQLGTASQVPSFLQVSEGERAQATADDVGTPGGLVRHLCHFTELDDFQETAQGVSAGLRFPENIGFRRIMKHYFSCVDPRAEYAVMATPGGDVGEFINAVSAMEVLQQRPFSDTEINAILQDFVRVVLGRGKTYFYMHTDQPSLDRLKAAAGVADPLRPRSAEERNRLLQAAVVPNNVGCLHLRKMLESPAAYGVNKAAVENVIRAYLNVYYDPFNPLREHLLYVVSSGEPTPSPAYARIWSPDECPGIAPLLVPKVGSTQVMINHAAHAQFMRQDLARYFAWKNTMVDVMDLYKQIQRIATMQEAKLNGVYTSAAAPTDVIFTSLWDRWPF